MRAWYKYTAHAYLPDKVNIDFFLAGFNAAKRILTKKKKVLTKLLLVGAAAALMQGCASLGMVGVQDRAVARAAQAHDWWILLEQGRITLEDYQALKKLQGPLNRWYE